MEDNKFKNLRCPMDATVMVIGGKYKIKIIFYLMLETLRYSQLRKLLPHVSDKTLSQQLKELEADGVIKRTVYPTIPPKTEYSLTEKGKALRPTLVELYHWGERIFEENEIPNTCNIEELENNIPALHNK